MSRYAKVKVPDYLKIHNRRILWHRSRLDPGGSIFGPGPYLKLKWTEEGREDWGATNRQYYPGTLSMRLVGLERRLMRWYWVIPCRKPRKTGKTRPTPRYSLVKSGHRLSERFKRK